MATIVPFPKVIRHSDAPKAPPCVHAAPAAPAAVGGGGSRIWAALVDAVWVLLAFTWPVLRRLLALNVLYHVCRAIYFGNAQEIMALIGHFAVFVAVTYFVTRRRR